MLPASAHVTCSEGGEMRVWGKGELTSFAGREGKGKKGEYVRGILTRGFSFQATPYCLQSTLYVEREVEE